MCVSPCSYAARRAGCSQPLARYHATSSARVSSTGRKVSETLLDQAEVRPGGALEALDGWLDAMNTDRDWSLLSMELQMHARRDKAFAAHYDRLFAKHRAAMGRLVERLFTDLGRTPPAPPLEIASAFMALAHGMVLQRRPTTRGAPDPSGPMINIILKSLIETSPSRQLPENSTSAVD